MTRRRPPFELPLVEREGVGECVVCVETGWYSTFGPAFFIAIFLFFVAALVVIATASIPFGMPLFCVGLVSALCWVRRVVSRKVLAIEGDQEASICYRGLFGVRKRFEGTPRVWCVGVELFETQLLSHDVREFVGFAVIVEVSGGVFVAMVSQSVREAQRKAELLAARLAVDARSSETIIRAPQRHGVFIWFFSREGVTFS